MKTGEFRWQNKRVVRSGDKIEGKQIIRVGGFGWGEEVQMNSVCVCVHVHRCFGGGEDCMQSVERMSLQLRSHK